MKMPATTTKAKLDPLPGFSALPHDEANRGAQSLSVQPHFVLVPSLACPAACSYCFGPHQGPVMSPQTMASVLDFITWIAAQARLKKVKVTFHGGEPLLAGYALWHQALEGLRQQFGPRGYEVTVQSNLWLLDDEFCRLFADHKVEIGTSLDGPEEITDHQRGRGYFARTMQGVQKASCYGMKVGYIATFTPYSASRWREVFDFFLDERLNFATHAAVPRLNFQDGQHAISPEQYGSLLCQMLDHYVEHRREISVSSLDQMCQGFACGDGKVCTFRDCLGMFLAIDPARGVYPCQRFCGRPEWRLGTLDECPSLEELLASPVAQRFRDRYVRIREVCAGCAYFDCCKGGCPYNAWAQECDEQTKDPYCAAYRTVFDRIHDRLLQEMGSEENIEAVAARPYDGRGHPLLKKGPLIELAREGPHPSEIARTARRIVAAVELARGPDLPSVAARLVALGICRSQESAEASLENLQRELHPDRPRLNNFYLHVTFDCQLRCTHCYARASETDRTAMPVEAVLSLARQAYAVGFRQVVITGGEPLVHPDRNRLFQELAVVRAEVHPMNLVLRTNLALPLSDDDLLAITVAFDQVVASVDGNEETHDARRGRGSYVATIRNLERYVECRTSEIQDPELPSAELTLACVMSGADIQGEPGNAVRQLADHLNIRARFRAVLPLGRAKDWPVPPALEAVDSYDDPMDLIVRGFKPCVTCGLGQNLFVDPSGNAFPCYAFHQPPFHLGNVLRADLGAVLKTGPFRRLCYQTVETNFRCRQCPVRYLCGGACRAWCEPSTQYSLHAALCDCGVLRQPADALLVAAIKFLGTPCISEVGS